MPRRVVEVAPARLDGWLERFAVNNPDGPQRVVGVDRFDHDPLALVLVRRGGYAVGLASGERLGAHKVGTRYVQSRTAAGGWSQQRFARRRANQADELVAATVEHAVRVLGGPAGAVRMPAGSGLLVGGDRALVAAALEDPRLAGLVELPRRELYDLPDPRLVVLRQALERARAVRVTIEE
ncbi:acVLRF1 family peptidyl-tRNA hydrolase [Fodinibacter luteus]|uniref:AcVLRF1 family peptidyl-tRNA hydrolase n=1 Tax=Fodinibacter luteus TaxID=552064 RepID=A0ABP8K9N5_9MICO